MRPTAFFRSILLLAVAAASSPAIAQPGFTQAAPIPQQPPPGAVAQPPGTLTPPRVQLQPGATVAPGAAAPAAGAKAPTEVRLTWAQPRPIVATIGSTQRVTAML